MSSSGCSEVKGRRLAGIDLAQFVTGTFCSGVPNMSVVVSIKRALRTLEKSAPNPALSPRRNCLAVGPAVRGGETPLAAAGLKTRSSLYSRDSGYGPDQQSPPFPSSPPRAAELLRQTAKRPPSSGDYPKSWPVELPHLNGLRQWSLATVTAASPRSGDHCGEITWISEGLSVTDTAAVSAEVIQPSGL